MEPVLTLHELMIGILAILILVFLFIIALLIFSFREYRIVENRQVWKEKIEEYLSRVIIEGTADQIDVDSDIEQYLRYRAFRRYFLNRLVESERKFKGIAADVLQQVFYTYKLDQEAYTLLRSRRPYLIARGIQVLKIMKVAAALPEIKTKIKDKHIRIRQEAQYAIVYFEGFDGLAFLDQIKTVLSDWQQLRILTFINILPKDANPRLITWLNSENPSVVVFALRLIQKFKVLELHKKLIPLLSHADNAVSLESIRTMFVLDVYDTADCLVAQYPSLGMPQQWEIIKGLGYTRAKDQIDFLKLEFTNHPTAKGKESIANSLVSLGELNYLINLKLTYNDQDKNWKIITHVLDNR
ncbi:hypothetical protein GQF61_02160 [Sphingobacterium sp. DK4209]|nr:hypothetical protein [Sphingobacterium sp. DK4209]